MGRWFVGGIVIKLQVTFKLLVLALIYVIFVGGKMSYVPVDAQGTGTTRKDAMMTQLQETCSSPSIKHLEDEPR